MVCKKIVGSFIILLVSLTVLAQQKGTIILGTIEDGTSKAPLEFASVQLLNAIDSAVINTTVTDRKGKFILANVNNGNYVLNCTFIGYETFVTQLTISNQPRINTGTLFLFSLSKNLNTVVVTGKKSLLNTSIDRKIYNVSQDVMAQSGSASDILKNIPSVEVDIDGNVSFKRFGRIFSINKWQTFTINGQIQFYLYLEVNIFCATDASRL